MRRMVVLATVLVVSLAGTSAAVAQEWKEFTSKDDRFKALFPGDPVLTTTVWNSEYGAVLDAHVYTGTRGAGTYILTVVDYSTVSKQLTEKAKRCTPGDELCDGLSQYSGAGYWKNDVRGAMMYALFQLETRPNVTVSHLNWNVYNCPACIEVYQVHLANAVAQTRTHALIYMHEFRLYILEGTVPTTYPAPDIFTSALTLYNERMGQPRYEGVYFFGPRVDPYEQPGPGEGSLPRAEPAR